MFKVAEHKSTPQLEMAAGATTFLSMVYVLAVSPMILSFAGMPRDALFTATALATIAATLIMGLVANLPFAVAPGMGIIGFFVVVATQMGFTWQQALTAVLISGALFVILSFSPLREKVLREVSPALQHAVAAGIGLMIAHIGLRNSGILAIDQSGMYSLGVITSGPGLLAVIGFFVTGALMATRFRFALLAGIVLTTLIGIPLGVTDTSGLSAGVFALPPSPGPVAFKFDFSILASGAFWGVVLTLLFMEVFDGLAGFIALFTVMGRKEAELYRYKLGRAFIADSIGVLAGAAVGVSPNTTYGESGSGVAMGGRTGMTAVSVAALFGLCLLLSSFFLMIPASAVAPSLVMVGLLMMASLTSLNFKDVTESFPAFAIIVIIAFTLSLSDGLAVGWILFILMKLLRGKKAELTTTVWVVGVLFLAKEVLAR
ncbi:MAG: NCS2 family permease [Deltaproteobacteria bacterium]|jgi:AGZA family xanthine/uracil permease-like MFS transporter|nr:NCS2 family permease [Deltaproteobacteria bacterium]